MLKMFNVVSICVCFTWWCCVTSMEGSTSGWEVAAICNSKRKWDAGLHYVFFEMGSVLASENAGHEYLNSR